LLSEAIAKHLLSPGAVAETVGTGTGTGGRARARSRSRSRSAVHSGGSGRRTALAAHVRRNVGSVLGRLLAALAQAEAAHVELISHVGKNRVSGRVGDGRNAGS
jgi:hypothetical protein